MKRLIKTFSIDEHTIEFNAEKHGSDIFVEAQCPKCGFLAKSNDSGHGQDHAATVTEMKIRSHLRISHAVFQWSAIPLARHAA